MVQVSTITRRTRVVQRGSKGNADDACEGVSVSPSKIQSHGVLRSNGNGGISRKVLRRCFVLLVIGSTLIVNIMQYAVIRRTRIDNEDVVKRLQADYDGSSGIDSGRGLLSSISRGGSIYSSEGLVSDGKDNANENEHTERRKQDNDNSDKPCAFLFFGIVKDFKDLALPAIQKNIIAPNPHCDIFLHTYDLDKVPINERNKETKNDAYIDPKEAYLLTSPDRVHIESMESFESRRMAFLEHSRKHHHRHSWGRCCLSHDNMIKQWHSINGAWELMREHEMKILDKLKLGKENDNQNEKDKDKNNHYYQQVGLFRADVYQVNPIDIFDAQAAVPNFANFGGYNDRLFYGSYRNAALWANRFGFAPIFEKRYMIRQNYWTKFLIKIGMGRRGSDGYHSEFILGNLMKHYDIAPTRVNVCMWRIRNGKRLQVTDCGSDGKMDEFQRYNGLHGYVYAPDGYIRDKRVNKGKWQWAGHWSDVWDDTVRQDVGGDIDLDSLKINLNADADADVNVNTKATSSLAISSISSNKSNPSSPTRTPPVFVLGMFESGGPLLTRLLAEGYSYHVGSNTTINDQFELKSMSSQNDAFLWSHGLSWSADVDMYTNDRAWGLIENETIPTACGALSLTQIQIHTRKELSLPWVVNDPRFSITFQTWLPLLESKPAVIYSYRDPLEVAWLLKEEHGFELGRGLILWILYNKHAIQNSVSNDICRVTTSNHAMVTNTLSELDRIVHELSTKCGQPTPSTKLNQDILDSFMEEYGPSLQKMPIEPLTISKDNVNADGDCKVYEYQARDGAEGFVEASLYSKATKIYCDLQKGIAYHKDYIWPELTESEKGVHLQLDQLPVDVEKQLRRRYHSCAGVNHTLTDDDTR